MTKLFLFRPPIMRDRTRGEGMNLHHLRQCIQHHWRGVAVRVWWMDGVLPGYLPSLLGRVGVGVGESAHEEHRLSRLNDADMTPQQRWLRFEADVRQALDGGTHPWLVYDKPTLYNLRRAVQLLGIGEVHLALPPDQEPAPCGVVDVQPGADGRLRFVWLESVPWQ